MSASGQSGVKGWINPYSFVWAPDRSPQEDSGLGTGLAATAEDSWSGWLVIELVVATPLLVPDANRKTKVTVEVTTTPRAGGDLRTEERIHWIYPTAVEHGSEERPRLPETSFKGALRAAYEAVTNSRFGVFDPGRRKRDDVTLTRDFLHHSLRPATRNRDSGTADTSPADRLFGTVSERSGDDQPLQVRGRLRVAELAAEEGAEIKRVPETASVPATDGSSHVGLTLPALFAPKGKYPPFYLRKVSTQGVPEPLNFQDIPFFNSPNKESFRTSGRKFYWHHQEFDWPLNVAPTHMNRSISSYVGCGTRFRAVIQLTNALTGDLHALLQLIKAFEPVNGGTAQSYFRLGYGKPLGFGSATLTLVDAQLHSGSQLAERIRSLRPSPPNPLMWPDGVSPAEEDAWQQLPEELWPSSPADEAVSPTRALPVLDSAVAQLRVIGQGAPHSRFSYPRAEEQDGTSLDWFLRNDQNALTQAATAEGMASEFGVGSSNSSGVEFHALPMLPLTEDDPKDDPKWAAHVLPELPPPSEDEDLEQAEEPT